MISRIVIQGYRLFRSLDLEPRPGMNIVVGDNASGKSTLLEALTLGLTGRLHGRWAGDELNPYWFNTAEVARFFEARKAGDLSVSPPEIAIELYLSNDDVALQPLRGVYNSRGEDCPGLRMHIHPSAEYGVDFEDYLANEACPDILPVEYYEVDWRDFSDERLLRRPKGLAVAAIDSRTIRSSAGMDYHTRTMMSEYIDKSERTAISIAHRSSRHAMSSGALATVNLRIAAEVSDLYDEEVGLHMDQSARASWEADLVPHVEKVPFAMAGQGQQAAIKVALAMHRSADNTSFVLVEEPENHMSHTSLTKLVARIEKLAADRQVFVTTHSSFVLNRLGLDSLVLLYQGAKASFSDLPTDTVKYFQRLSGYDTLRLVLAKTVVLVEGPSDEIVLERAYRDRHGATPMARGVDVISMQGVSLRRGLELCAALDRRAAAVRDSDGKQPSHWTTPLQPLLKNGVRAVFIGDPAAGHTLEPQLVGANSEAGLKTLLGCPDDDDLAEWMRAHKTETALTIARSEDRIAYPPYIEATLDFLG